MKSLQWTNPPRQNRLVVTRVGGDWEEMDVGFLFVGMTCFNIYRSDCCTVWGRCQSHLIVYFKWLNFVVCKLYLKKAV